MRVLITGAAGMLGLDVQAAAVRAGHEAVAVSRAELDICDPAAVAAALKDARPDAVINCAAYTQVDRAEEDVEAATRVNGEAPGVLGEAAAACGAWVVHVSTDYVFDGSKTSGPYVESDPTGPRSVYGVTKLAGERALAAALPDAHTIVRTAWLFGTGGPCFPATILRAARSRPELQVVDDQIGSPTYTPHLAAALLSLADARNAPGVVHVAAGGQTSWFGFASALVAEAQTWEARGGEGDASHASGEGWASVGPCTTAEYPRPAPRPAYSVLRSEREEVPVLADWRVGLEEYMAARGIKGVA
jgi:dTDP-4-dehydrorhamnose reductase